MAENERGRQMLSEREMREMFTQIGKSKEDTAQGIVEQQRKAEEEKQKRFRGLLSRMKDDVGFDDSIDLDEEVAALEREMELVRAGRLHKYPTERDESDGPDALEASFMSDMDNSHTEHGGANPALEFQSCDSDKDSAQQNALTPPLEGEAVEALQPKADNDGAEECAAKATEESNPEALAESDSKLNEDAKVKIEILETLLPKSDVGYFAAVHNAQTGRIGFAYQLCPREGEPASAQVMREGENWQQVVFDGAFEMLNAIDEVGCKSIVLYMDNDLCEILRKSAIYGIADEYSESCARYIKKARELGGRCCIRLVDSAKFGKPDERQCKAHSCAVALVEGESNESI